MNNIVESVFVDLCSRSRQDRKILHSYLKNKGFRSEDDYYSIQRTGKNPDWQSSALLSVDICLLGRRIYETHEDIDSGETLAGWDGLKVEYLLATLPRDCIVPACSHVGDIATAFNLTMVVDGKICTTDQLSDVINSYAEDLSRSFGDPGSEQLRLMIEQQYQK